MSRDIKLLHPELQKIIPRFLEDCKKNGLILKITDTLRDEATQNDLYAQGREEEGNIVTWVKYPFSSHNWGIAFDFCRDDGKGAFNDSDNFFYKVGQIGKKYGLEWGGDWRPNSDKPHLEYLKYGDAKKLYNKYKTLDNFKKTWGKDKYMFVDRKFKTRDKIETFKVINEEGENYISIRDIANLLNLKVSYENNTKITILEMIENKIDLYLDTKEIKISSINSDGYNFVKLRELCEALGYNIYFENNKIKIKNNN